MVPIETFGRLIDFSPFLAFGDGRELMSARTSSTQLRASANSSRVTVSGIMISTIGSYPLAATSSAASISARTCMA